MVGLVSDAFSGPYAVYSALVDSDLAFVPAAADGGESARRHAGDDRRAPGEPRSVELSRSAWESYADGYLARPEHARRELATAIKQGVFSTRVRRHASPLAASLSALEHPGRRSSTT